MKSKLLGLAAVAALAIGFATSGASAFPADKASISSSALVFKHLADADGTDPSAANVTLSWPDQIQDFNPGRCHSNISHGMPAANQIENSSKVG